MRERTVRRIRRTLLRWYDTHARRLPWRQTRDPYRIWVAETMLQQTRIKVVLPAYRRFVRIFPDLRRLAAADEESVLSLWSGLGYYSRARALHRAAQLLVAAGERSFPCEFEEARDLPGVGEYTAAAVLSIAYGKPHAAIDGNVRRVLSRLALVDASGGAPYRVLANRLLARRRAGDWNQAVMELGETICLPRAPRCGVCPLRRDCAAHRRGRVSNYPVPPPRRRREHVHVSFLVLCDRTGRVVLERGVFTFLDHMWLPLTLSTGANGAEALCPEGAILAGSFRHTILHRDCEVRVYKRTAGRSEIKRALAAGERALFDARQRAAIGRASLLVKALRTAGIATRSSRCQPLRIAASRIV